MEDCNLLLEPIKKISRCLVMWCLLVPLWHINAQNETLLTRDSIRRNVLRQMALYPQEKLHLHLDRDMYVPGEKIWFKAYLVDAATHLESFNSRYVYVELVSADSLVSRVMVRPEDGMYYGHIPITEMLPEGDYTVRAYTRYMENMGDGYFFTKNIRIGKIETGMASAASKTEKKKPAKKPEGDYDVSFFPEGGNLAAGVLCNIGIKVLNNTGLSEFISGTIIDEKDEVIRNIDTYYAGMGRFSFIPEKGKTYYLKCTNRKGITKTFKLPEAAPAYALATLLREGNIYINLRKSAGLPDKLFYVLMHSRGNAFYFEPWNHKTGTVILNKKELPAGIIQILLLDEQLNPLSERLVFNKKEEEIHVRFNSDKEKYGIRDKVGLRLQVADSNEAPLNAKLSVSVTDDKDIPVDESTTILSSLLLSSELKGHIENPGYYFANNEVETDMALDNLMLTQGWRRYNIPEVVIGNMETPKIPFETNQSISGTVKSLLLNKPVVNGQVTLYSNTGDFDLMETDMEGRFAFSGFEYPDSTIFFLQSANKSGGRHIEMLLNERLFPKTKHVPRQMEVLSESNIAKGVETIDDAFVNKATMRSKYDDNMRIVHLPNIEVVASKINKEDRNLHWYSASSDATVTRKDLERLKPVKVLDALIRVAGIQVGNDNISLRGGSPLFLVDGIQIPEDDSYTLRMLRVEEVERIDVYKGASAAIWGSRGYYGVISITTRNFFDFSEKEVFFRNILTPLGFQKPVEFYSPKYETPESKYLGNPDYRTTIYWKPDLAASADEGASFEFYTSDFPTTYSVVIEGITDEGHIIRETGKIRVE